MFLWKWYGLRCTLRLHGADLHQEGARCGRWRRSKNTLSAVSTELGATATASANVAVTVTVVQPPTITFTAVPTGGTLTGTTININVGQSATLAWSIGNNPTSMSIDQGVGAQSQNPGQVNVSPTASTTYTLTASNLAGSPQAQVTVNVTQMPVISTFTASPGTLVAGRSTTLSWSAQGATSYLLSWTVPGNQTSGQAVVSGTSAVVAPSQTTNYTLTACNSAGNTPSPVLTVTVEPAGTLAWLKDLLYLGAREVAEVDGTGVHPVQLDHLNSPFYALSVNGTILERQKYLPFGETLDQRGSLTTSKGFTNHEQTDASGLIYMQARFYLPMYHRFASPDPARDQHFEETQSWNIYSYCQNEPVMRADPTGEFMFQSFNNARANLEVGPQIFVHTITSQATNPTAESTTNSTNDKPKAQTGADAKKITMPDALSEKGEAFLKTQEGYNDKLNDDSQGHATIGWGHKVSDNSINSKGDPAIEKYKDGITKDAAQALFKADVKWVVDGIKKNVNASLTTEQFDALVSVGFNAGRSALIKSPMVKNVEAGNFTAAGNAIKTFRADGLEKRRLAESNLFTSGVY